ncbi:MAG: HlyD family efflux transporter periplasmic adaptor subunit [Planctomycetota bacterium]
MSTLAQSLVSSSSRTLPIRVRPDLRARRQRYQGRTYWVVKDPVALQYFRFEEEEFAILQMLDGESSLDEIAERFEREFPPQTIRTEELQQFIGMLHRSGLVIADAGGQGVQLKKRRDDRTKKERWAKMSNVLAIRFKGIDPERALNLLYSFPPVRWFFSTSALVLCGLLVLSAATLVLVNFETFQSRLPSFQAYFAVDNWNNWILLGLVLSGTKILHEFGHGLACKHFGGECHEMGVMFLVLTPCLYCNVSDSWMLPNRWHRAAIGAAGMYVEVVLASLCTWIWWFTDSESMINQVCLNIMFISSVSTILFNANPLLRYDGYYILSDLMEIPNLRQKASSILTRKLGKWCLGLEEPDDPFLPKRNQAFFALFTVASAIYRWVVVLSIVWFLNQVLEPYGLKRLGQLIALSALWGLLGQPLWKLYKFLKVPGRLHKVKRVRMYATAAIVIAAIVAVVQVPLPTTVQCPVVIQPRRAETVYIKAPGVLKELLVEPGDVVNKGRRLAVLENLEVDLQIARLETQIAQYEAQLKDLGQLSLSVRGADDQLAQVTELLAAAREQLAKQQEDAERLVLVAPVAGVVIPPPIKNNPQPDERALPVWQGTPLDKKNLGATFEPAPFCMIGPVGEYAAELAIPAAENNFVNVGQKVEVLLDQSPDYTYRGKLEEKSPRTRNDTPPRLSSLAGGEIPTQMDENGVPRPLEPFIDATVPFVPPADRSQMTASQREAHDLLRVGLTGTAKIRIQDRTLWDRLYRYLSQTFLEI